MNMMLLSTKKQDLENHKKHNRLLTILDRRSTSTSFYKDKLNKETASIRVRLIERVKFSFRKAAQISSHQGNFCYKLIEREEK